MADLSPRGTPTSKPVIVAEGLTKRFGSRVAFEDLSFEVEAGEIFGFLGPNGAGKTTTVRVLATLLAPSAGRAEVAGLPIGPSLSPRQASELRQRISVMPENSGLYTRLSVRENLEFFARLYGVGRGDLSGRIVECLRAVGIEDRADSLAGTLSKGLRQRAGLARSLLPRPTVLFLDEPTSGLDPEASLMVRELIASLRERGTAIFLTTHRLDEAERLCDRVAVLKTRLRSVGPPAELRRQVFSGALEVRLAEALPDPERVFGPIAGISAWQPRPGPGSYILQTAEPAAVAPKVVRAIVAAGADVIRVAEVEHSLEDVYLELVESPA
ncbi:MAG TPA: ABC transporter ATP-binding protein [Actinomycetota bacterium]|nr:ABC transporter ATP-binding protein [Actinomycetota bacterium]